MHDDREQDEEGDNRDVLQQQDPQGGRPEAGGQLARLVHQLQHKGGRRQGEGGPDDDGLVNRPNGGQAGVGVEDVDQDFGAQAVPDGQTHESKHERGGSHGDGAEAKRVLGQRLEAIE